jgi:hypothetical protein
MTESNYDYTFEAEKNQSTQPGFKPFDTLKAALGYMEEDGVLRVTCNPTVNDRIRTRTIYMMSERTIGLSEQEVFQKLDEEVEKSLLEPMAVNYGDIKDLSMADLIALEKWLDGQKDYWSELSGKSPENSPPLENPARQYEICTAIREAVSTEISARVAKIFPDFEPSPDKENSDSVQ